MIDSSITGLTIENSPVQVFSIDSSTSLTLTDITIDNSAGGTEAANTDGFDVGDSTYISIVGANGKTNSPKASPACSNLLSNQLPIKMIA